MLFHPGLRVEQVHILCVGLNHTTASLDLREKLAMSEDDSRSALASLGVDRPIDHIKELVILSTCNRTELYFTAEGVDFDGMEAFLSERTHVTVSDFNRQLYRYTDEEVIDHLFRVATGLDSMVLGEPQILGQVIRSLELALECSACGTVLSNLFRSAIHAGKRARAETSISRNPASISSLAATLVAKEVKNFSTAQVLVVGAGEMAELAVEALRKRGVSKIVVINRTLKRAETLAARWQASAYTFEHLVPWLAQADIVISSTSAASTIITAQLMNRIMDQRSQRRIIMFDIAVPRDIDPEVHHIQGVRLFNLDTLNVQVQRLMEVRSGEVPQVEAILTEEKTRFMEYLKTLDMLPLITGLRKQAETIRQQELLTTLHHLPGLSDGERKRIDAMTRSLVKKLLASPTRRLRDEATCPHALEYATVTRTLFELEEDSELCAFSHEVCPLPDRISCSQK